jgi:hypothetical protein
MARRSFIAAVAIVIAATVVGKTQAQQEAYGLGYQYGVGFNYADAYTGHWGHHGHGFAGHPFQRFPLNHIWTMRVEEPPYFAKFPPVYYDADIVKRPYGISPYAVPPGILPTEMYVAPAQSARIVNPYVDKAASPPTPPAPETPNNDA